MGNNGKEPIEVFRVVAEEGKISITVGKVSFQLMSHAFRLLNLQIDNMILGAEARKQSSDAPKVIKVSKDIANRVLRGNS